MSIMLPGHLSEVLNWLGFNWPDIDEDQLRVAADHLRTYARNAHESAGTTEGRIRDLSASYEAHSYTALVEGWSQQTRGHMDTLIEGCGLLADGLDLAATGVEGMKMQVIAQLGIAAAEFIADQAAAVATFGIAEGALPLLYAAQNRILGAILKTFEWEVVTKLLDHTLGPLRERIEHAVNNLVFPEAAVALGVKTEGVKVDADLLLQHGAATHQEAAANASAGSTLVGNLSSLSFGSG